jgi:hypothetical protein
MELLNFLIKRDTELFNLQTDFMKNMTKLEIKFSWTYLVLKYNIKKMMKLLDMTRLEIL